MANTSFENLIVWQSARRFANEIYNAMEQNKDWSFRDQIQRAVVSIMNNIAEGCDSGSNPKFLNFLNIAKASCSEVRSMLYLGLDRKYINLSVFNRLLMDNRSLNAQLYRLIQSLTNKTPNSKP